MRKIKYIVKVGHFVFYFLKVQIRQGTFLCRINHTLSNAYQTPREAWLCSLRAYAGRSIDSFLRLWSSLMIMDILFWDRGKGVLLYCSLMLLKIIDTFMWENLGASRGKWPEKVNSARRQEEHPTIQRCLAGAWVRGKMCVTDKRLAVLKLLICVLSLSSPLPMEMSVLSVFLHLS